MNKILFLIFFLIPVMVYAQNDETGTDIPVQNIPKALTSELQALKTAESTGDKIGKGHSLGELGNIYLQIAGQQENIQPSDLISADKNTNLDKSIDYAKKSVDVCDEIGDVDQLKASYKILYAAQKMSGNVKGAMSTYGKMMTLKHSILNPKKEKEFELRRFQYETTRRQDSMRHQQQLQQQLADEQLKKQQQAIKQQQQVIASTQQENAKVSHALQQTQTDLTVEKTNLQERDKQLTLAQEEEVLDSANMQLTKSKLQLQQDEIDKQKTAIEQHKRERIFYIYGILGLAAFLILVFYNFRVQKRSAKELENINNIVKAINSEMDFSNLMKVLLQKTKDIADEKAIVLDYNAETRIFRIIANLGHDAEFVERLETNINKIIINDVRDVFTKNAKEVQKGLFYTASVTGNDMIHKFYGENYEIKSMLVMEIKVNEKTEQFLLLENSKKENAFGKQDFSLLKKLKEHLISAFIKIALLEDIQNKVVSLNETVKNLHETQDLLVRQEKLASIGQLTKGIVDRILNPLMYINEFSKIAKEDTAEIIKTVEGMELPADDKAEIEDIYKSIDTNLQKVMEHGTSASRVVKGMQKILREKTTEFVETDINQLILKVVQAIRKEYPENVVKISLDLDKKNQKIKMLAEMETALTNLLSNGCYSAHEKSIKATAGYTPEVVITTAFKPAATEIRIRDNGKGIPVKETQQLFSPFFTTKPTSVGTGLGLYITQDIVKSHHGEISFASKEGEYAEFIINLPKS